MGRFKFKEAAAACHWTGWREFIEEENKEIKRGRGRKDAKVGVGDLRERKFSP